MEAGPIGTAMRAMHRPLRRQPARGRRKLRLNISRALRKGRQGRSERDTGTRVPEPERSQAIKRPVPTDKLADACWLAGLCPSCNFWNAPVCLEQSPQSEP